VVPFLWVADLERSRHFYVAGLGATVDREWIMDGRRRWCRLGLGAAALMLQERGPGHDLGAPPGAGISLNFTCDDALALYENALAAGLDPVREPQVGNGLWEIGYADPDGYRIHFASPTDLPEELLVSAYRVSERAARQKKPAG
jgi:catechol 2,3-dioxygenase-like lactoylglutathione lyase family enzyme